MPVSNIQLNFTCRKVLWVIVVPVFLFLSACSKAPAVEFTAETDDGLFDSKQHNGEVIYLDFWASWCGPCRQSFPWMNEMRDKYAEQGLKVIAVSLDHDKDLARRFADEFEAEFTIGFDTRSELADQFDVRGLPASVLISRKGKMLAMHAGFNDEQAIEYESEIVKALN